MKNVQLAFNDYILMHLNIACVRGIFCVNNKENYIKKIEHIKKNYKIHLYSKMR